MQYKMFTCNFSGFSLLWFLLCLCKSNGIMPGHPISSGSVGTPASSESTPGEAGHMINYMHGGESGSSQQLSPGKDVPECSMPFYCCDYKECQCDDFLPDKILRCGSAGGQLSVLNSYCLTLDEETDTFDVGHCLYNYNTRELLYNDLPNIKSMLVDHMCSKEMELNRTGTLCGKCRDGYYPLAYSFSMECVPCPNGKSNWWKFVLAAFLPLTIFYLIILFFNINVVSSRFQGFLFYSQIVTTPALIRVLVFLINYDNKGERKTLRNSFQSVATFYGIWNLDFFRAIDLGICLGTDTLQTLVLDYIVAVYPLLLVVMSYFLIALYDRNFKVLVIIAKPFLSLSSLFRKNWNLRTSLIDAFATIFLLTNIKFQGVSFDLLTPVKVYHLNNTGHWTYSTRLFYDATVPYFGARHLPYAIVALTVTTLFVLLPVLLLVLYPFRCFQKLLNLFPFRWYILHTFVDSFYGSFKDGTQPGTRDCRWFASLFFVSRFCTMFTAAFLESAMVFPVVAMTLTLVAILFITVQPLKEEVRHFTNINVFFILLLALLFSWSTESSFKWLVFTPVLFFFIAITVLFPLLYISAIVLHWIYSQRMFGRDVIARFRAWKNGYRTLH
jgi:hypothetical protein